MKKSLLSKHAIIHRLLVLLFLWVPLLVVAQCPTIPDSNPVICDASGFTFADLNAYAVDQGNGIVWYDSPTGGSPYSSTQLVRQLTYYAGDNTGTCTPRSSITIDFVVNPSGQNLDGIFCNNENPTIQLYIDQVLQPNVPPGGSVLVYTNNNLTTLANPSDPIPGGATNYFIVFVDNGGCRSQIEPGSTAVFDAPEDPTPQNPQEFCSDANPTVNELDPGTTSSFSWYQNIDGSGEPILPALALSTPLVDGSTYYVQINDIFCVSNAVPVTVSINIPPEPGASATLEYCEDNIPTSDFNLFDELTGSPDTTGTWTGPLPTSNGHLGTVNISSLTTPGSYVFTYSLGAVGVCPESSSTVTIIIREILSSGIPSADNPASFCEVDLPSGFDLFSLLDNEDPGGLWTQGLTSSDAAVSSPIDLTGFAPGTYDFTYSQNVNPNPCPEESTTVQVIVLADPNAGLAVNQVFCENDLAANSPFDLFDALDGSQDNNSGIWTDSGGATVTNPIDISGFTIADSPYTYTYTIDNGTCFDTEDITITVEPAPESGTANPDAEICVADITSGQTFDLFDLLEGEDQSGVWSDDSSSGALTGNLVTIDGLATGTYDFTFDVNAIGTCDDVLVTVSIIINDTPTPTGLATQSFCDSATVADLSATGNNILWYNDATGGTALGSTDALVDGENYFATQTDATTGCESSVRLEVNVIINQSPNSGSPNSTPLTVCDNNTGVDLFNGLDGSQDATGTWDDTDSTGALTGNIFDASLVGAGSYSFTYTVTGNPPCVDSSTIISVTVEETVFAGTDTTLDVCSDSGTVDLLALLGGADAGGTWSPSLTSGTNIFDPTSDSSGTYTYTLTNSCSTDSSDIVITVTQAPNAGSDATADLCVVNGIIDLTTYLGGTPDTNGTWSPLLTSGTNDFDPTVDSAGIYTYTVSAISPCTTDASAQLTVTISDSTAPVVVEPNMVFCLSENPTVSDLDSAVSGDSISWYDDETSTTPLDPTDILLDGDDYFATQTSGSGCESSQRVEVNVTINDTPTPTLASEGDEFCISDRPTLFELTANILEYDSSTNNITWYDSETGGAVLSSSTLLEHETYYYATLFDPSTGCESRYRLPVLADLTACGAVVFPDGFSPNGDGVNDRYEVENLAFLHPDFVLEIYNRYGNLVYVGKAGTQLFDGTSNQSRLVTKGDLPVGVYFYVVNFNDGTKSKQGRIYLSR